MQNISIVFDDNPIARGYAQLFRLRSYKFDNLFLLNSAKIFKILKFNINKKKKNFHALEMIKSGKFEKSFNYLEEFFLLEKGFIKNMYKHDIENLSKNKIDIFTSSINSKEIVTNNLFKKTTLLLNTTYQIIKNTEFFSKKILHVHPAKLPEIKGADGSLWQIHKFNSLSCSVFYINQKIDEGEVIFINDFEIPRLNDLSFKLKNISEKYRFWFSFVDPLLRSKTLDIFLKKGNIDKNKIENNINNVSNYYSFMTSDDKEIVFKKVFT